jgi:hypothetical protein
LLVPDSAFNDSEFQVSSQWGEDGLVQFLVSRVPIPNRIFVEFGVQNYREANTRFLLQNDNWRGLVIDGSVANIRAIRSDPIYWRHNLKAVRAFVTASNIDAVITGQGLAGDIGLLSIDIDGADYWVWNAVTCVQPRIVICEFNAIFGPTATVSVPYDPAFRRNVAHHSGLFAGASLGALAHLARLKGYMLIGINSNANNAFFVRSDVAGSLDAVAPHDAYRSAMFRESLGPDGRRLFATQEEARNLIGEMEVVDVRSGDRIPVRSLF